MITSVLVCILFRVFESYFRVVESLSAEEVREYASYDASFMYYLFVMSCSQA